MAIKKWIKKIKDADSTEKLEAIVEEMAFDDEITHQEYSIAYELALYRSIEMN